MTLIFPIPRRGRNVPRPGANQGAIAMMLTVSEQIHPTAVIDPDAILAADVQVGPYAIIEGPVEVGSECVIEAHACI
jgi:UDP-3-O-[3-hydroxymyristoyl] glucosamine N-acyltransferase